MSNSARSAADRCPGVFRTHAAADGAVTRIRLPGGRIRADQLGALAAAAAAHGDGFLEPTVRGNLQLRGITDVDAVAGTVLDAGLAPSSAQERIRNIEVSPLTGRIGGLTDVWPIADLLDTALRGADAPVGLSGRFLFGIDDGRGDIVGRGCDVTAVARAADPIRADILLDGEPVGSATGAAGIVAALLAAARGLPAIAPGAWRVADLSATDRQQLADTVRDDLDPPIGTGAAPVDPGPTPIVGWFDQLDGRVLLGTVVELGRLPARLAEFIAAVDKPVILTPDREILLADLDEAVAETVVRVLAPMGLIFDANSPWTRLTGCVGAPGCAKSATPVRADLLDRAASDRPVTEREHWVGCARGCGSPAGTHLRVAADPTAGDDGYRRERCGPDTDR